MYFLKGKIFGGETSEYSNSNYSNRSNENGSQEEKNEYVKFDDNNKNENLLDNDYRSNTY